MKTISNQIKKGDYVMFGDSLCKVLHLPSGIGFFAGELIVCKVFPDGKLSPRSFNVSPDSVTLCANPEAILAAMKVEQAIESLQSSLDTTRQALNELLASVQKQAVNVINPQDLQD